MSGRWKNCDTGTGDGSCIRQVVEKIEDKSSDFGMKCGRRRERERGRGG